MPPLETRTDSMGRLQKYPKIHVSIGEESLEAPKQLEWGLAFSEPAERVPEVPVVSLEHLLQLEKI